MSLAKKRTGRASPSLRIRVLAGVAATLAVLLLSLAYPWLAKQHVWFIAEWRHPWLLLLLALVPFIWWRAVLGQDSRQPRIKVGSVVALRSARRGLRVRLRSLPGILRTVAVALFILALARPVQILSDQGRDETGIDIVLVMDLSGSMRAVLDAEAKDLPAGFKVPKNYRLTRLDIAKMVVRDFIRRRVSDRIGVIVFGRAAYVLSPPTLDYTLLGKLVAGLRLDVIDGGRTALGDAIGTGVARLRRSDANSKVIIVLTDGDNNAGRVSPEYAIELANTVGAKIYTIQIGDGAEVEVRVGTGPFGKPRYGRARFPTNPALLERIAKRTAGEAFVATDARALRESMHNILDHLEKTRFEASAAHHEELFAFLLFPGVFLLGLEALLRALVLRRFP